MQRRRSNTSGETAGLDGQIADRAIDCRASRANHDRIASDRIASGVSGLALSRVQVEHVRELRATGLSHPEIKDRLDLPLDAIAEICRYPLCPVTVEPYVCPDCHLRVGLVPCVICAAKGGGSGIGGSGVGDRVRPV